MLKLAALGSALLCVSPFVHVQPVHAQSPMDAMQRLSAADWNAMTDMRIDLIKNALQLTSDQQKLWGPVEEAIRNRAKNRMTRMERMMETTGARAQETPMERLRNRDPIGFLNRRADALAQRSADLKQLASAWQPLYATLSPEQKARMAAVALFVLRDMSEAVEHRRMEMMDDDDDDS